MTFCDVTIILDDMTSIEIRNLVQLLMLCSITNNVS